MTYAEPTDHLPRTSADRAGTRRTEHAREVAQLDRLAGLMDSRFGIPGTRFRFGFDSILGLVPGVGDALTLAPSAYLIFRAHKLGAPKRTVAKMAVNAGLDATVGAVPILGDVFDLFYKSNKRNMALLKGHLEADAARDFRPDVSAVSVEPGGDPARKM